MNVLQQLNQHYDEIADKGDKPVLLIETARAMMLAYAMHYEKADAKVKVRGIEVPFCMELPVPDDLPEEIRPTKPRYITGVIDSIIEDDQGIHGTDLKTASWASPAYWQELHTNLQLTTYNFAMYANGYENGFLWDVVSKPTIKPKALTKASRSEIEGGAYCGWPTSEGVPEDGDESPRLYGIRLLQWYLDSPEKHMERRYYQRNASELLDFVYWQHYTQSAMEKLQRDVLGGDLNLATKNFDQCSAYGSLCGFHGHCAGFDPDKTGLQVRPVREGSFDVGYSTSQIRTFMSCRRKWVHKYLDRLEPVGGERSDATDVGSLVHAGREIVLQNRLERPIVLPLDGPVMVAGQ